MAYLTTPSAVTHSGRATRARLRWRRPSLEFKRATAARAFWYASDNLVRVHRDGLLELVSLGSFGDCTRAVVRATRCKKQRVRKPFPDSLYNVVASQS